MNNQRSFFSNISITVLRRMLWWAAICWSLYCLPVRSKLQRTEGKTGFCRNVSSDQMLLDSLYNIEFSGRAGTTTRLCMLCINQTTGLSARHNPQFVIFHITLVSTALLCNVTYIYRSVPYSLTYLLRLNFFSAVCDKQSRDFTRYSHIRNL